MQHDQLKAIKVNKKVILKILLLLLFLTWCIGFTYPALFKSSETAVYLYPIFNAIYGNICHQNIEKTIYFNGNHFLICSRCSGIYVGILITSFLFIFIQKKIKLKNGYLYLSVVPILLDIIFYSLGVYPYSKSIAFITGWLLGSVGFLYIFGSFEKILFKKI